MTPASPSTSSGPSCSTCRPYLEPEEAENGRPRTIAAAARKAIRTAMDFQLLAGDSWHANTPRKGHPTDRVANFHHETSTCVACHPTHFTTQSALAAVKAGYEVEQPFALQFLTERLANNPVPFHGHPERPLGPDDPGPGERAGPALDHRHGLRGPGRRRPPRQPPPGDRRVPQALLRRPRPTLPPDESNGNNPVSRYKVATDSWRQLDEVARRTGDARYAGTRDLVAKLLPTGRAGQHPRPGRADDRPLPDRPEAGKLAGKIESNVHGCSSLQRPNGHWSVKFDPNYPITEMQTGESLYALSLAGRTADDPAMRRGIVALLTASSRSAAGSTSTPTSSSARRSARPSGP